MPALSSLLQMSYIGIYNTYLKTDIPQLLCGLCVRVSGVNQRHRVRFDLCARGLAVEGNADGRSWTWPWRSGVCTQ